MGAKRLRTDPAAVQHPRVLPAPNARPGPGLGYAASVFAFLPTLGFQEMFVIVLLGVLLYGRNLPDVGRKVGRTVAQLRKGMHEFKAQMDRDESLRELRDTVRDTRDEVRRAGTIPRALTDPARAVRDLAENALKEAEPASDAANGEPGSSATGDSGPRDPGTGDPELKDAAAKEPPHA